MCGITGFNWKDELLIKNMTDLIKHRGPDDHGYYINHGVSLGHRRLSILDLSKAGHQPMSYKWKNKSFIITFNGEVYNYQEIREELKKHGFIFKSNTDTEVILAAYCKWGTDCVKRFNGMWAFCILDIKENCFFLSRDRFGKKPLYYYSQNNRFLFASEIKSLLAYDIPRVANKKTLSNYLYFDMMNYSDQTFYKDIYMLAPGTNMTFSLTDSTQKSYRYYKLKIRDYNIPPRQIRESLKESVRLRLISDVPVSISLSGGIDSSSLAAIVPELTQDSMQAFTTASGIANQGDETDLIKHLLDRYPSYELTKNILSEEDFVKDYRKVIYHMDEPFLSYSPYVRWVIAKTVEDNKRKVLLVGEGADEFIGGYDGAGSFFLKDLLAKGKFITFFRELIYAILLPERKSVLLGFLYLLLPNKQKKFVLRRMAKCLKEKYGIKLDISIEDRFSQLSISNLKQHLYKISTVGSLPYLLNCNDKMSMAHAVESRAPFIDYRFVDLIFGIAHEQYVHNGYRKYILREAMDKYVPDSILYRRKKQAFFAPIERYLKNPKIKKRIFSIFVKAKTKDIFSSKRYLRNYECFLANKKSDLGFILKGLWLEEWMRIFNIE